MFEIKIYGEIVPFQDGWVVESGYCNLTHVQAQLAKAEGKDIRVRINSCGGDVDEGFAIYSELRRYAADNNAKVTTLAEGRCASIATVIFLAGDNRILNEFVEPFVHNAWTYAVGDANIIQRIAADLEKCNEKIANHYANHTNLTSDEARQLMNAETFITSDEALSMRFATQIEELMRPVALQRFSNQKRNLKPIFNTMSNEKTLIQRIKALLGGVQNKLVATADQREIDFYELEEDDEITVGAKATIDGEDPDGKIVGADGTLYVFEAGELIRDPEPPADEDGDGGSDDSEIENLRAELKELREKYESVSAKAKAQAAVIAQVRKYQSEDQDFEPSARPTNRAKSKTDPDAERIEKIKKISNLKLK